ncbi:hypothetical protein GPECTOR_151g45 [Gonium pectorale]|uniref:BTB domain-containing protein n=1 Tax=Gonium pectorale TaxID=33097 RepID=A0A150FXP9_GONPE|nr:hypothetical protein GPECTOR_151g45 [Gonium pectorale]|eukprot:KXZ42404.1 hypothetical protein GPECTOR_151g45 [Gonium pectorale]
MPTHGSAATTPPPAEADRVTPVEIEVRLSQQMSLQRRIRVATHGSSAATPLAEADRVTLTFPSGGQTLSISAPASTFKNASGVLKAVLEEPLPTPCVLALDDGSEDAAAWFAVVQMAELRAYPSALVTWDLMHLADKYDMPVVGAACWDYISRNKASLTLDAPLASPKNLLRAASLCSRYSSGNAPTPAGCPGVEEVLALALAPLSGMRGEGSSRGAAAPRDVAAKLRALVKDEHYTTTLSAAVQARVVAALLDAAVKHFPSQ